MARQRPEGDPGEVRDLLEGGADPMAMEDLGYTRIPAVYYAVERGHPEIVEFFFDAGVDVDLVWGFPWRPVPIRTRGLGAAGPHS